MLEQAGDSSCMGHVWQECIKALGQSQEIPIRQAIEESTPLAMNNDQMTIGVPGPWYRDFLTRPENARIVASVLQEITGKEIRPEFLVLESNPKNNPLHPLHPPEAPTPASPGLPRPECCQLNPRYTFDSFVQGNENRLAAAAALAVAKNPAQTYNPLFIYGGVGLGKTHLMHAIGHYVKKHRPQPRVVYVTSERFTNELIHSIQEGVMKRFRDHYRNVDILLVDDVQFLVNKERTQEEFFHTFNELHSAARQIVLTSDRSPRQISTLEDRLRSRFEMGMLADIQQPDLETRMAILRKKAEQFHLDIPHEVTAFIAEKIPSHVRELEGALTRVVAYCSFQDLPVTLENTEKALRGILEEPTTLDIPTIQAAVCEYFKISMEELVGRRRDQRIVVPRQVAMYLCKKLIPDASYPEIGAHFGKKDHTTVLHAFRKVEKQLDNPYYQTSIKNLENMLREYRRRS